MSKGNRIPIWQAEKIALQMLNKLAAEGVVSQICGSVRRGTKSTVGDLDIVVSDLQKATSALLGEAIGVKIAKFKFQGMDVQMRPAEPGFWGAMMMHMTGNPAFNMIARTLARKRGLKLNEYGVWDGDTRIAGATEEDIFAAIGMRYVLPEEREKKFR